MTQPDSDAVVLRIDDLGIELDRWTSYTFSSAFMTPADGFQFAVGDPDIPDGVSGKLAPGMRVTLMVSGRPLCTGYLDEVAKNADRSGGTVFECSGRDILADAVDSCVDPYQTFQPTQTLEQIVTSVLGKFGVASVEFDNAANKSVVTGNKYGLRKNKTSVTKKGKLRKSSGQINKQALSHLAKPYPGEHAYEFCERLAKRQGLHIWAKADGSGVIVGRPDYSDAGESTPKLVRRRGIGRGASNNIVSGHVKVSRLNQPSVIIAAATTGGVEFSRARMRCIMVNHIYGRSKDSDGNYIYAPEVEDILNRFPDAYVIGIEDVDGYPSPLTVDPFPHARPLFLEDPEASTLDQLKAFTMREMAQRQVGSLEASYEVYGHSQNGLTWATDTMVNVDDDVGGIHEQLWVSSVSFSKDRSGGTRTTLGLSRPYTLTL